jgi:hypothetical protein
MLDHAEIGEWQTSFAESKRIDLFKHESLIVSTNTLRGSCPPVAPVLPNIPTFNWLAFRTLPSQNPASTDRRCNERSVTFLSLCHI